MITLQITNCKFHAHVYNTTVVLFVVLLVVLLVIHFDSFFPAERVC